MTISPLWLSPIGQRRTDRHNFEQSLHKGGPDFTMTSKALSILYLIPSNLLLNAKLESGKSPTLGTCWPPNSGGVACQPLAGSVEQTERLTPDLARTEDLGNAAPRRHCPVKMLSANNYRVQYSTTGVCLQDGLSPRCSRSSRTSGGDVVSVAH